MNRVSLIVIGIFFLMVFVGVAAAASEMGVQPVRVEGNPTCADLVGCTAETVKIEISRSYPSGPQELAIEGGKVTFTINSITDIDWHSDVPVACIIVKGGNAANVYHYEGGVTEDWGLTPPENSGGNFGLSHLDYCGIATPEFPTIALPVGMMVGFVGLIYAVKKREN